MNGMEILSSQTIYNTILPDWLGAISLGMLVVFVIFCVVSLTSYKNTAAIIYLILTIASVVLFVLSMTSDKTDINHIEYKVIIDDSVSMNEFLDKYEILDQEGKIYTIKERNNE